MDKILLAIATLLWPMIVILVVVGFWPAIRDIIDSARSRKFALKIGGQELTMEEASHGQQRLIMDLLMQVAMIEKKVHIREPLDHADTTASSAIPVSRGASVLWVDDTPKNISYLLETLRDLGMKVDEATSTADGMDLFSSRLYDFVISDMRRQEGRNFNQTAGLELLKKVRDKSVKIPFILFTGDGSIKECGKAARELGVTDMTSSPTRLLGILNAETLKSPRKTALGK
jgi:CheY-like chemotaxis protein